MKKAITVFLLCVMMVLSGCMSKVTEPDKVLLPQTTEHLVQGEGGLAANLALGGLVCPLDGALYLLLNGKVYHLEGEASYVIAQDVLGGLQTVDGQLYYMGEEGLYRQGDDSAELVFACDGALWYGNWYIWDQEDVLVFRGEEEESAQRLYAPPGFFNVQADEGVLYVQTDKGVWGYVGESWSLLVENVAAYTVSGGEIYWVDSDCTALWRTVDGVAKQVAQAQFLPEAPLVVKDTAVMAMQMYQGELYLLSYPMEGGETWWSEPDTYPMGVIDDSVYLRRGGQIIRCSADFAQTVPLMAAE